VPEADRILGVRARSSQAPSPHSSTSSVAVEAPRATLRFGHPPCGTSSRH
jgi:hypothetical protein